MKGMLRFATRRPLTFVILTTVAWMLMAGLAACFAARVLGSTLMNDTAQSIGTLTVTACLVLLMWRWGWLRAAGVTVLGNARLWLLTVVLTILLVLVYQLGFFGKIVLNLPDLWASGEAQAILQRNAVVGTVEEVLFRGFLLFALLRVWGNTRRGVLAAVTVPALFFAVLHILQVFSGNPLDDTLMTIFSALVGGLWCGALVILGGSIWPAVLIHAATNASVQLGAASITGFDPSALNYAAATAFELPLVVIGLWLLLRKEPSRLAARPQGLVCQVKAAVASTIRPLLLLLVAGGLLLTGCAGRVAPTPTRTPHPPAVIEAKFSAAERLALFDTVWQTVNEEYYDPTFGGLDWQAIGDEYRQKLATVEDDDSFWRQVLNPMLWELGVSHMVALPPELAELIDRMTFATGSLGLDVRLLDGVAVVTRVVEDSPADEAGLQPGFVITSVDGWTLADLAAEALPSPPYNERHRRGSQVQGLRDLMYGETGTEVDVEYQDADDRPRSVTLQFAPRLNSACAEFDPSLPPACAEVEVRSLKNGIGYLRFSGFLNAVLDDVLRAIEGLHDAPALIIDLRGNPGGIFFVRKAIASHLVGKPELFIRYKLRDGWDDAYLDEVPDAYPGEIVILVDEHSASSSEEFAGSLQAMGRATIIGSQTPGSCLTANIVPLLRGAVLVYPFSQPQTADGRVLEDNGVLPDIAIELDRQQLLQGIDAQLEAAFDYLK